ncbi:MAG: hypothetical protein NC313_00700 [Butyrivibrio sp.]|nr:hypothetical protein [Butyrivibrio sp.]
MGFLGLMGEFLGEMVKDTTGIDVEKGINIVKKSGSLEEAFYAVKDDMEGTAYKRFRQELHSLTDEQFKRIRTDDFIDVKMRAYEDEKRRRRL